MTANIATIGQSSTPNTARVIISTSRHPGGFSSSLGR